MTFNLQNPVLESQVMQQKCAGPIKLSFTSKKPVLKFIVQQKAFCLKALVWGHSEGEET